MTNTWIIFSLRRGAERVLSEKWITDSGFDNERPCNFESPNLTTDDASSGATRTFLLYSVLLS